MDDHLDRYPTMRPRHRGEYLGPWQSRNLSDPTVAASWVRRDSQNQSTATIDVYLIDHGRAFFACSNASFGGSYAGGSRGSDAHEIFTNDAASIDAWLQERGAILTT